MIDPECQECGNHVGLPECPDCDGEGCDTCDDTGVLDDDGQPIDPSDILCAACARDALLDATRDWYSM